MRATWWFYSSCVFSEKSHLPWTVDVVQSHALSMHTAWSSPLVLSAKASLLYTHTSRRLQVIRANGRRKCTFAVFKTMHDNPSGSWDGASSSSAFWLPTFCPRINQRLKAPPILLLTSLRTCFRTFGFPHVVICILNYFVIVCWILWIWHQLQLSVASSLPQWRFLTWWTWSTQGWCAGTLDVTHRSERNRTH